MTLPTENSVFLYYLKYFSTNNNIMIKHLSIIFY